MSNVYATLVGGVGNQLFQAAAAYAYAKKYDKNLILDDARWTISHGSPGKSPSEYKDNIFKNFTFSSHNPESAPTQIFESQFNYNELPYVAGDVELNGYFQSLKYFEEYSEEFKDLLDINYAISNIENFGNLGVAAHIRRTDYLQHHAIHYVCDTDYFRKSFCFFPTETIDVYSDSINYVVNEFEFSKNLRFITGCNDITTLAMLSQYDSIIASNSSFSWWASFLGKKKSKIIVPDKWFKNYEEHDDIYRSEFTRIPV